MASPDIRICFLGDSYVQGTGDPECLGWAGRLCVSARRAGHNITYYNLGVRRETSADILRRWQAECEPRLLPDTENYLVFSFGANDVTLVDDRRRVAESETLGHLQAMLQDAARRYRTLMIGPPPAADDGHNRRLARLSEHMEAAAGRLGVPWIATLPSLIDDTAWRDEVRNNDGAHPRAAGYARLAQVISASGSWWFAKP